jgi:hypothetical protein
MTNEAGPNIVYNGLSLSLDAANSRSYPGTGTTWTDLSGNNRNATIVGSPTFVSGNDGNFSGFSNSNYITLSNSGLVPRANDFTYSGWINFNAKDTADTIFENGSWADSLLVRFETSQLVIWAEGSQRGTFAWNPTVGVWYNFVLIRSGNIMRFYANNVLTGTPFTMNLDIDLANTQLWLMRSQHATDQQTNGKISNFMIYNRALSLPEIAQNYNALKGRYGL